MRSFITELKRRDVFKVGVAYAIIAWLLIQVTDIVAPALHLPDWTVTLIVYLLLIGFPLALFLAWAYELTPEGIKPTTEAAPGASITRQTGRKLNYLVIGLLVLLLAVVIIDNYVLKKTPEVTGQSPAPAAISSTVTTAPTVAQATAPVVPANSIAVLPFTNISSDPEQEYFSDGLSEELTNQLAQIQGLRVIGRTSAFTFKGKNEDLRMIGAALGVSHLLEGSVRKAGEALRITAQLVDARDGAHLWSKTYDRALSDIFAVQEDISKTVAETLQVSFGLGEFSRPGWTRNVAAYDEYLQGKSYSRQSTPQSLPKAVEHYQHAIDIDPAFILARTGLVETFC